MRLLYAFLLLLISSNTGFSAQVSKSLFESLSYEINRSVLFSRLSDGKVLYQENANQALIPASITKIATSISALGLFGVNHSFDTQIFYTGKKSNGTITGDLVIKASGDPLLINEKLWQMAADFDHMGVRKIQGNLVIDNSLFDNQHRDRSRIGQKKLSRNAYDAPITAFGINFNTFPITIYPGEKLNSPALVNIDPYRISGISINNRVTTSNGEYSKLQAIRKTNKGKTEINVIGQIGKSSNLKKIYRSVSSPLEIGAKTFRSFLEQRGITILGTNQISQLPHDSRLLYTIKGEPLKRIIDGLNKYSNNYIADMLTKNLGVHFSKDSAHNRFETGSLSSGSEVIEKYLTDKIKIRGPFDINNGSGLDTRNKLSAYQIVEILKYAAQNMDLFPEFLASLPTANVDGTLKNRFKNYESSLIGNLRAKTGTLTSPVSVASLAGYFHHPKQGLVAFAIIENGSHSKPQPSIYNLQQSQEKAISNLWRQL